MAAVALVPDPPCLCISAYLTYMYAPLYTEDTFSLDREAHCIGT